MLKRVLLIHADSGQIAGYTYVSGPANVPWKDYDSAWFDAIKIHLDDLGWKLLATNGADLWRAVNPDLPENVEFVAQFEIPERRYPHGAKEWRPDPERPASWRPKENLGMGGKPMTPRPISSVIGELAYLRGRMALLGPNGIKYPIRRLMDLVRKDLKQGPEEARKALLDPSYWYEDDPEGRTRIMRQTPTGTEVVFVEVSPWS